MLQDSSSPHKKWTSRHKPKGEIWRHKEPAPIPLLNPKNSFIWSSTPLDPLDFTNHMQNFYWDHCQDALGGISEVLGDNFNFKFGMAKKHSSRIKGFFGQLDLPVHHELYESRPFRGLSTLLSDVVHDIPTELLGSLLHEELSTQRDRHLFFEGATGGALNFIPSSQSGDSENGYLLYAGNRGMTKINFHKVQLKQRQDKCLSVNLENKPFSFQLKSPIRQISSASLFDICCTAVRSDYYCGVWRFSQMEEPRLLQVLNTAELATCVNVSPHVLGEILVASESGKTHLWTIGKGTQTVLEDDCNLYFNAKSSWRWCEFSAHPRVMIYADRTGADLCDIRTSTASNQTLFKISNTAECRTGERVFLCKYLTDAHLFHHLITTQYSAYIMDERFPCVPMLKIDHMMQSPPVFSHILPGGSSSKDDDDRTTKILLGSQRDQEIMQLQYSGSGSKACVSAGPPQELFRPCDSFNYLPAHVPHRMDIATTRLSSAAAGLTCIRKSATEGSDESVCVLQLTEAGDIFYQVLEHKPLGDNSLPVSANEPLPCLTWKKLLKPTPERGSNSECIENGTNNAHTTQGTPINMTSNNIPIKATPGKLSQDALVTWKIWLQKLFLKERQKNPPSQHPKLVTVMTSDILTVSNDQVHTLSDDKYVRNMKEHLSACMANRSLLVQVPSFSRHSGVVPFPDTVHTAAWNDDLSQRLTLCWRSRDNWRKWWDDRLGVNKEEKLRELRRKRRKEKAERSGRRQMDLSESFTSSIAYQSELESFCEFSDWASVGSQSQGAWSDGGETLGGQFEGSMGFETPKAKKPAILLNEDAVTPTPVDVNQSNAFPTTSTPSTQKRPVHKRLADDYLNFTFGSQDNTFQENISFSVEDLPLQPMAQSYQNRGAQIQSSQIQGSQIQGSQIQSSQIQSSQIQSSQIQGSQIQGSQIQSSQIQSSQIQGSQIQSSQIQSSQIQSSQIQSSQIQGSQIQSSQSLPLSSQGHTRRLLSQLSKPKKKKARMGF
ncbi:TATA box-binding protein-associated factor, RNA polymerase I, subunit C isoform X2 [Stigmatopora nigra]